MQVRIHARIVLCVHMRPWNVKSRRVSGTRPNRRKLVATMMVKNVFQDVQRIQKSAFWFGVGCACVGTYIAYRFWRQGERKLIDEGFEEVSEVEDGDEKRIVLLGLAGAGKTSIVDQLCVIPLEYKVHSIPQPTQGSTIYRIKNGMRGYYIWDIGGTNPTKKYWGAFLQDTNLLVYVVDSSDYEKLPQAVTTLKELLGDSRIGTVPILVIANKQDCPNALKPEKMREALDLLSIPRQKHKVEILPCATRPLPHDTWHHESIDAVRKKIFEMAT